MNFRDLSDPKAILVVEQHKYYLKQSWKEKVSHIFRQGISPKESEWDSNSHTMATVQHFNHFTAKSSPVKSR